MTTQTIKTNVKSSNTHLLNNEINSRLSTIDSLINVDTSKMSDAQLASLELAVKKEQHHLIRAERANDRSHESKAQYLTYLASMSADASGYDKDKINTLITALNTKSIAKLNSGLKQALVHVKSFSDKQFIPVVRKNNVRTSMTLLSKLNLLEQNKEGRSIVSYSVVDSVSLAYFTSLV